MVLIGPRSLLNCFLLLILVISQNSMARQVSLSPTAKIENQGKYAYCAYYALANFLELWGDQVNRSKTLPIDVGYLALANNHDTQSGGYSDLTSAWVSLANHGAVPQQSLEQGSRSPWPGPNWESLNEKLLPRSELQSGLRATFSHVQLKKPFTGHSYLANRIGLDPRLFQLVDNQQPETFITLTPQTTTAASASPVKYRYSNLADTQRVQHQVARQLGVPVGRPVLSPEQLYSAVKKQLYRLRPVLLGLNIGLTKQLFQSYSVLSQADLVPLNQGQPYHHAVVAFAHCDQWNSVDPICRAFAAGMEHAGVSDCIVIENSWGEESHQRGFACIGQQAAARVFRQAIVGSDVLTK